jgi:cohesin loading factor subunit SCC2
VLLQVSLSELLFAADNLAYFGYQQQDEPLFAMHQIDIIVSVSGCNILDAYRQVTVVILQVKDSTSILRT